MARVVHFEIVSDNTNRASIFYQNVFGWGAQQRGNAPYVLLNTGPDDQPGINGALMPWIEPFPKKEGVHAYICTIEGPEIELASVAKKVQEAGGKQLTHKKYIPGIGTHAYFEDTEGNVFGVLESEKKSTV